MTTVSARSLGGLAMMIGGEVKQAEGCAHDAIRHAVNAGEMLTDAKALCKHGEWLPWLEANFTFTRQTATGSR